MTESILPQGISGFEPAESKTNFDRLHLVALGEPGSGKSRLSVTGRKPILVFDYDDRTESIAGFKDVLVKTYKDASQDRPNAWAETERDIGVLEYEFQNAKTLAVKTIVFDSLTFMLKAAHNQLMADQAHLCRTLRVNGRTYKITQGWDAVNVAKSMVEGLINRAFALKTDVILTAHIRKEKAADWTEENPSFTGKWTIEPQNLKMLLPMFNERWFMTDEFKVVTKPNYEFNGVTALNIDAVMPGDIEQILRTHEENTRRGPR
jgi:AAA domain-containing protein